MTTTHDDKARELLSCPHCGKRDSVILTTTHDAWDDEEIYADSAVVVCDASSRHGISERRGCGASGPCAETDEAAIAAWNRRAALSPASTGLDYVLMPRSLTADNGAKAALSGEFSEPSTHLCPSCGHEPDERSECDVCDGDGEVIEQVPVSWTTIKRIYEKAVEVCAAPAQQVEAEKADIDYKLLLAKYIEHVGAEEGTTFIGNLYRDADGTFKGFSDKVQFSIEEMAALQACDGMFGQSAAGSNNGEKG